jgi:hypothetical protein
MTGRDGGYRFWADAGIVVEKQGKCRRTVGIEGRGARAPSLNLELRSRHVNAAQFFQNRTQGHVRTRRATPTTSPHRGGELSFQGRSRAFIGAAGPIDDVLENPYSKQCQ